MPTPEQVAWNNRMQKVIAGYEKLTIEQLEEMEDWVDDKIEYFVQYPAVKYFFDTGIVTQEFATIIIPLYEDYYASIGIDLEA